MDRESHKRRLERFSRNERIFPGGEHESRNCTGCAQIITNGLVAKSWGITTRIIRQLPWRN